MNGDTSLADACKCCVDASRLGHAPTPAYILPRRYVQYGTHAEAVAARDKSAYLPSLAGVAVELRWNDRPYEQVVVVADVDVADVDVGPVMWALWRLLWRSITSHPVHSVAGRSLNRASPPRATRRRRGYPG